MSHITQCDRCRKKISSWPEADHVVIKATKGDSSEFDLCVDCYHFIIWTVIQGYREEKK